MPPCLHVCMYVCIRMCDARAYLGRYVGTLVVGLRACRYIDVPVGMHAVGMHASMDIFICVWVLLCQHSCTFDEA